MKCFLHIGTEKTATTTIQKFLNANRNALLEKKLIYTVSTGKINNRALPTAAYESKRRDNYTLQKGIETDNDLLNFQQATIEQLKQEVSTISKENPGCSLIFSSEHIQSRLTTTSEILTLKNILLSMGVTDISILVYLRNPADLACSLYSTAIKAGNLYDVPRKPDDPYWNNICNHRQTIERFSSVFGEKAIIPRLFEKDAFYNNSIIEDFLQAFDIPFDSSFTIPEKSNESLSTTGVELLRRLNTLIPKWIDNKHDNTRKKLISYFEQHFSDSKYTMPESMYSLYDEAFIESNEWVRDRYFTDRKQLFKPSITGKNQVALPEKELDAIAELIANIWNEHHQKQLE